MRCDRVGKVRTMNNGHVCKIIGYNSSTDMTVQFEDGTIKEHVTYGNFIRGTVSESIHRLGEVRTMNNGHTCKVIRYANNRDIDVQFDDGTIREHVRYGNFCSGEVGLPKQVKPPKVEERHKEDLAKSRLGVTRVMNCGLVCKVIEYKSAKDVTVQFMDGTLREHVYWRHFCSGRIRYPEGTIIRSKRLGERCMMSCGIEAEIINYKNSNEVDIRFEDGVVKRGIRYSHFKIGYVAHPELAIQKIQEGYVKYIDGKFYAKVLRVDNYTRSFDIELKDGRVALGCNRYVLYRGAEPHGRILTPAYTLDGVSYYTCEYKGSRYLGTVEEIRSQLGLEEC